jgi:DNA repair photolyase
MLRRLPLANPTSRFSAHHVEYEAEFVPLQGEELYEDASEGIISRNQSPDLPFSASVNPYRGCAHGCAYCYARPSHEYWGFGAGVDFDRKLIVKHRAPELLRRAFEARGWTGEQVVFSGNTDPYQPLEQRMTLTRRCLEVCLEFRNPVQIITKSTLIARDLDVLVELHAVAFAGIAVSIPFWNADVARQMEPYAPTPERRIQLIAKLANAGLPVIVFVSPLIPGLSDSDVIPILRAAREAGACAATSTMVRLPGPVQQVFTERIEAAFPDRAPKILRRIREMRAGKLNDAQFFARHRGQGNYAENVHAVFETTRRMLGFGEFPRVPRGTFKRPRADASQSPQMTFDWSK